MATMWCRFCVFGGGIAGGAGVALGALTAHTFAQRLDADGLSTLETASHYLLVHGLLLLLLANWHRSHPESAVLKVASVLAASGIVLFCGGLTVAVLSGIRAFGAGAPLGGSAFIGAWLAFALFARTKLE